MQALVIAGMALLCAGTTFGESVIKEAPLELQDTANLDGDELFNNLCAVCHGAGGEGNGPAVSALDKNVPDLTVIAVNNGGVYSHKKMERVISGESRVVAHGSIDMPVWGQQFMYVRPGWSSTMREAYARERIHTLTNYIESLQVN